MTINARTLVVSVLLACIMVSKCHPTKDDGRYTVLRSDVRLETSKGPIIGVLLRDEYTNLNVKAFYNIPFAQPPVGTLRFRPPQDIPAWTEPINCTKKDDSKTCTNHAVIHFGSEDCLYMNVYVPVTEQEDIPIFFWIYGGGYVLGDKDEFGWYDGRNLATQRTVIVVEANYRLGALGFLALSALGRESDGTTGNYGTQDQQLALQFAHTNAVAFGGKPDEITIAGESAGAFSVCWHMVSKISTKYFRAAIMESGTCESPIFFVQYERAITFGKEVVNAVKCNPNDNDEELLKCLRSKSAADFDFEKWTPIPIPGTNKSIVPPLSLFMPYGPAIDKHEMGLLDRPINIIGIEEYARKPMIMGTNHDEGTLFLPLMPVQIPGVKFPINKERALLAVEHFFNETTSKEIMEEYKGGFFESEADKLALILRDNMFLCATQFAAERLSQAGVPVWVYQFSMDLPSWIDWDVLGDYHTLEMDFVWDNRWPIKLVRPWGDREKYLTNNVGIFWTNLAKFLDVNRVTVDLHWPKYDIKLRETLELKTPLRTAQKLNYDKCEFWRNRKMKFFYE